MIAAIGFGCSRQYRPQRRVHKGVEGCQKGSQKLHHSVPHKSVFVREQAFGNGDECLPPEQIDVGRIVRFGKNHHRPTHVDEALSRAFPNSIHFVPAKHLKRGQDFGLCFFHGGPTQDTRQGLRCRSSHTKAGISTQAQHRRQNQFLDKGPWNDIVFCRATQFGEQIRRGDSQFLRQGLVGCLLLLLLLLLLIGSCLFVFCESQGDWKDDRCNVVAAYMERQSRQGIRCRPSHIHVHIHHQCL
mmetsp:Transcript_6473/g.18544  ORF Transcript_6473/g.18544 Transcript_6473/m.18544 type:complete len:243 (-) Transcript_6473:453-1181(-)